MYTEDWHEYIARQRKTAARISARVRRQERWKATARATVWHPRYGKVVVPHLSNLAAAENAAELWGVPWSEISTDAKVCMWVPEDGPVTLPQEFREEAE